MMELAYVAARQNENTIFLWGILSASLATPLSVSWAI
jgi:hypothetical protein